MVHERDEARENGRQLSREGGEGIEGPEAFLVTRYSPRSSCFQFSPYDSGELFRGGQLALQSAGQP